MGRPRTFAALAEQLCRREPPRVAAPITPDRYPLLVPVSEPGSGNHAPGRRADRGADRPVPPAASRYQSGPLAKHRRRRPLRPALCGVFCRSGSGLHSAPASVGSAARANPEGRAWFALSAGSFRAVVRRRGIGPRLVEQAVLRRFQAELAASAGRERADHSARAVIRAWTTTAAIVPGWPQTHRPRSHPRRWTPTWTSFLISPR